MAQAFYPFFTHQEYLDYEETATYRSEYREGHIYMMAGGSDTHNLVSSNIFAEIRQKIRGRKCRAYISDMKVFVKSSDFFTYPDVMALCGEPNFVQGRNDVITNPSVIFEVLSKSTQTYDRSGKFELYKGLESLQQYVLIEQKKVWVESYTRQPDQSWTLDVYSSLEDVLPLPTIETELPITYIYEQVEFPAPKRKSLKPLEEID